MSSNIINIQVTDNSGEILREFQKHCQNGLERCGMKAESYAVDLAPVDLGRLKESITHKVDEAAKTCYVGTNVEYALYVELGTGTAEGVKGGRQTPWVYYSEKLDRFVMTTGNPPQPFIKPAVADHVQTYRNILEDEFKG